jgi:hypothetical protein
MRKKQRAAKAAMLRADEKISTPVPYLSMSIKNDSGAAAVATRVGAPKTNIGLDAS